ncbi:hypothetical protein L210DRAFT_3034218 [Boletus edulis BED1]|uniref:Uncharacterized protein n=1 Tax=Boletus edulis BED1 TaxID=1328754 RepID=A0AAD4GIM1_BOLED|nr:hypothetical protein L210DRAFT_3034218 [Boletus edulis BED1]
MSSLPNTLTYRSVSSVHSVWSVLTSFVFPASDSVQDDDSRSYANRGDPKGDSGPFHPVVFAVVDDCDCAQIRETLHATFKSGVTCPLAWRKHQLYQLARKAQNEAEVICDTFAEDLSKPRLEVLFMAKVSARVWTQCRQSEQD